MDPNRQILNELLKLPGNDKCADCESPDPQWASFNIGVFLCDSCAGIHKSLGTHISMIKSVRLDRWDDIEIKFMKQQGNLKSKEKYEHHVPACYRRPNANSVYVMREQWIRAKYEREDFTESAPQLFLSGYKEDYLLKRGKIDNKFNKRRFVLSEADNTIKYFRKESAKEPKAIIKLDTLNVLFAPEKVGNLNGLQLSYEKDGLTRNLFVYAEDGKDTVEWYTAIRSCKLNRLRIAYPLTKDEELVSNLSRDFLKEGWLSKTGPKPSDGFKDRWFTLDKRKLMYSEDPLDAFPKGEVFLGNPENGYSVREGVPPSFKDQGYSFTLKTPDRRYVMSSDNQKDRTEWMAILNHIINIPMTTQDSKDMFYKK